MTVKPKINYKALQQKVVQFALQYHVIITVVVTILLVGFAVFRVSMLSNPSIDQEFIDDKSAELKRVQFDEAAIDRIQNLQDSGVDIESEFSNRENPFNE